MVQPDHRMRPAGEIERAAGAMAHNQFALPAHPPAAADKAGLVSRLLHAKEASGKSFSQIADEVCCGGGGGGGGGACATGACATGHGK
jgi:hypothetical protein